MVKIWKPSVDRWSNNVWSIHTEGHYSAMKVNPVSTNSNLDGTQENCAE